MRAIASAWRTYRLEVIWAVFAALNLVAMLLFPHQETVPFHFVWVSFSVLYGLRVWRLGPTLVVLGIVVAATTLALVRVEISYELTEIPLMAAMFLVMVWHARRRQRALEDLNDASERERDFLRDASHKLRTPIAISRGHVELIREAVSDRSVRADTDVVIDELENLARISDRILMLATASHPANLRSEQLDLADLVRRTGERWRAAADRAWRVTPGPSVLVDVDRDQLESALDAVLENAVRHTDARDAIEIVARLAGKEVHIVIRDSGAGIADADLPHVFERFYGTGVGPRRGTGLGLAIVKSVVEAHDGDVTIASVKGGGTTVTIALPFDGAVPAAQSQPVPVAG